VSDAPQLLPLAVDEVPDISDALIVQTVHMRAGLEADRERGALHIAMAEAFDRRDWEAVAEGHRRLAEIEPAAGRMVEVAQTFLDRYAETARRSPLPCASMDARIRRALVRTKAWMERRWWPLYGAPAPDPSCAEIMTSKLAAFDRQLARMAGDPRPSSRFARSVITADRNAQALSCRVCDGCPLSNSDVTRPLPMP